MYKICLHGVINPALQVLYLLKYTHSPTHSTHSHTILRIEDANPPPHLTNLNALSSRTADPPLPTPENLPAKTPASPQPRFAESSIYPYLETNVDDVAMSFTGGGPESIPPERSAWSVQMHGPATPFRHWRVLRDYVAALWRRGGYGDLVSYCTTVERAEKVGGEWVVTLRRAGGEGGLDSWWTETFDAVVVASGHFSVPWIPAVEGLQGLEEARPGSVLHSKMFRGREDYRGKVSRKGSVFPTDDTLRLLMRMPLY